MRTVQELSGKRCVLAAGLATALLLQCTPQPATTVASKPVIDTHQFYSQDKKLLVQADSLFQAEQYEVAKNIYTRIREAYPQTAAGAQAQYNLGYVNIYYDNPFADFQAALREFKRFQSDYPNDKRIVMVNNWIRLLTILRDFDEGYARSNEQYRTFKEKQRALMRNFETLQDVYLRYDSTIDSLKQHIKKLEGVIEYLDSTRG